MRAVIQRVTSARVTVGGRVVGKIEKGLAVLLGVHLKDTEEDARYIAGKIASLRIFEDDEGRLNQSVEEAGGEILLVSQFTLYADTKKGRRPSFSEAAGGQEAIKLYGSVKDLLVSRGLEVETGSFGEHMIVEIHNDGPVTVILESR